MSILFTLVTFLLFIAVTYLRSTRRQAEQPDGQERTRRQLPGPREGREERPGGARVGEYRWDGSAGTELWVDPASGTVLVTMWQSSPANPDQLRQRITALVREAVQP